MANAFPRNRISFRKLWLAVLTVWLFQPQLGIGIKPIDIFKGYAMEDANVNQVFYDEAGQECRCRNRCFSKMSCKSATIYRNPTDYPGGLKCVLSDNALKTWELRANPSALTLLTALEKPTCTEPYEMIPTVGCIYILPNVFGTMQDRRNACHDIDGDLFVADSAQHLQALNNKSTHTFFDLWVGVYGDKWLDGRTIQAAELAPDQVPGNDTCGTVIAPGIIYIKSCNYFDHYFVCQRRTW